MEGESPTPNKVIRLRTPTLFDTAIGRLKFIAC